MSSQVGVSDACSMRITEQMERLASIQRSAARCLQPVGIIGPGDGGARECEAAFRVGTVLAKAGMAIVYGGRAGVMGAAARGASEAGGIVVGILPEDDARSANRHLSVAIPTGMGEMRNAVIARSSICLVAIGGGMGTISEAALGLKWGKSVFALYEDIQLPGARFAGDVDQLIEWVLACLLEQIAPEGEPSQMRYPQPVTCSHGSGFMVAVAQPIGPTRKQVIGSAWHGSVTRSLRLCASNNGGTVLPLSANNGEPWRWIHDRELALCDRRFQGVPLQAGIA